jgi:16S rRNA processing protein RimM
MTQGDPNLITAGRVGRAHGLDGSFYVTEPVAPLLTAGALLALAGRPAKIVRRAGTDARPIVRLDAMDSREEAQAARGEPLLLAAEHTPQLGPDEYWSHELEGCEVHDGKRPVGVVARLVRLPSCEALEVSMADGRQLLVPMVRDAIRSVDTTARRIEIDMGFLGES